MQTLRRTLILFRLELLALGSPPKPKIHDNDWPERNRRSFRFHHGKPLRLMEAAAPWVDIDILAHILKKMGQSLAN